MHQWVRAGGFPFGCMSNLIYIIGMEKVRRELIAVRIDPSAWHSARVASVQTMKPLGQWLEEAIQEKVGREKGVQNVSQTNI